MTALFHWLGRPLWPPYPIGTSNPMTVGADPCGRPSGDFIIQFENLEILLNPIFGPVSNLSAYAVPDSV